MANENLAFDIVPEETFDVLNVKQLDSLYDEVARRLDQKKPPIESEDGLSPNDDCVSIHLSYDTYLDIMSRKGDYERELDQQGKRLANEYNKKLRYQKRSDNFLKVVLFGTGLYVGFKLAVESAEDLRKLRAERKAAKEAKKAEKAARKASKQNQSENQGA